MKSNLEILALDLATKAHGQTKRKLSDDLYIVHPIEVSSILKKHGGSEELIAAGLLHDVIEDTEYTLEDIVDMFGDKVAKIILSNTENKTKTWIERKTHTIESIKNCTLEERLLLVADKYSNLSSIKKTLELNDEKEVWSKFKESKEKQQWYYESIFNNLNKNLDEKEQNHPLFIELGLLIQSVFHK